MRESGGDPSWRPRVGEEEGEGEEGSEGVPGWQAKGSVRASGGEVGQRQRGGIWNGSTEEGFQRLLPVTPFRKSRREWLAWFRYPFC